MSTSPAATDTVRLKSRVQFQLLAATTAEIDLREAGLRETGPGARRLLGDTTTAVDQSRTGRQRTAAAAAGEPMGWSDFAADPAPPGRRARVVTRTFDLVVSLTALILLAPVMVAVAIAVRLDSPGPVMYGSGRVGHDKPEFKAWKFRSMRPDADQVLAALLRRDDKARQEYLEFHKLRHDPRLTSVGRFIRRTSLDELPQLFNIVRGEMSVVGPRPKLHRDAEVFGDALPLVLQVKPGLTGLWQVSGRNRLSIRDQVTLDLQYAQNRSFTGDVIICGKTFMQLWQPGRNGAY